MPTVNTQPLKAWVPLRVSKEGLSSHDFGQSLNKVWEGRVSASWCRKKGQREGHSRGEGHSPPNLESSVRIFVFVFSCVALGNQAQEARPRGIHKIEPVLEFNTGRHRPSTEALCI